MTPEEVLRNLNWINATFMCGGLLLVWFAVEKTLVQAREFVSRPEHQVVPQSKPYFFDYIIARLFRRNLVPTLLTLILTNLIVVALCHHVFCRSIPNPNPTPGVPYYAIMGDPFYAQVGAPIPLMNFFVGLQCALYNAFVCLVGLSLFIMLAPAYPRRKLWQFLGGLTFTLLVLSSFVVAYLLEPALPAQEGFDPPYTMAVVTPRLAPMVLAAVSIVFVPIALEFFHHNRLRIIAED